MHEPTVGVASGRVSVPRVPLAASTASSCPAPSSDAFSSAQNLLSHLREGEERTPHAVATCHAPENARERTRARIQAIL